MLQDVKKEKKYGFSKGTYCYVSTNCWGRGSFNTELVPVITSGKWRRASRKMVKGDLYLISNGLLGVRVGRIKNV